MHEQYPFFPTNCKSIILKMTSTILEDIHARQLQKLLEDSGLECSRSPQISTPSESEESSIVDEGPEDITKPETPEVQKEEVVKVEEKIEEEPLFPSSLLRRVLPYKVREFEEKTRVHVLPFEFKEDVDPEEIPKIRHTAPQKCIDILAEIVGCQDYKCSLGEFWFLDTLANLLRRAQEDELDRPAQAILIHWFCEWMKEIQNFDAADRVRMLERFKENMLASAKFAALEGHLPTPTEAGVSYKPLDTTPIVPLTASAASPVLKSGRKEKLAKLDTSGSRPSTASTAGSVPTPEAKEMPVRKPPPARIMFTKATFACTVNDMTKIFHYIFDLFSTEYQFDLIRSVFTFTPSHTIINLPNQIQNPKTCYDPSNKAKKQMSHTKQQGKENEPEEGYMSDFLEQKMKHDQELEEQEKRARHEYELRSHILPLQFAGTEELFDKLWPPPKPYRASPKPVSKQKRKEGKGR